MEEKSESDREVEAIDIFVFSNGQQYSPPRKYHLKMQELRCWESTLSYLARVHYGSMHTAIALYTIDGRKIQKPNDLRNCSAYVAVEPPDSFRQSGYDKYLIKASRSWEKRQRQKNCDVSTQDHCYTKSFSLSPTFQAILVNPLAAQQKYILDSVTTEKKDEISKVAENIRKFNEFQKNTAVANIQPAKVNQNSNNTKTPGKIVSNSATPSELNAKKIAVNRRNLLRVNTRLNRSAIPAKTRKFESSTLTSKLYSHIGPKVEDRNFRSSIPRAINTPTVLNHEPAAPQNAAMKLPNVSLPPSTNSPRNLENNLILITDDNISTVTQSIEPKQEALRSAIEMVYNNPIVNRTTTGAENYIDESNDPMMLTYIQSPIKRETSEKATENDTNIPIPSENDTAVTENSQNSRKDATITKLVPQTVVDNKDATAKKDLKSNLMVGTDNNPNQAVDKSQEAGNIKAQENNVNDLQIHDLYKNLDTQYPSSFGNVSKSNDSDFSSSNSSGDQSKTENVEYLNNKALNDGNYLKSSSVGQPLPALQNALAVANKPKDKNDQYIAVISQGDVVNLKFDIEVKNVQGILKTSQRVRSQKSRSCTDLHEDSIDGNDENISKSKSSQSCVSDCSPHMCCRKKQKKHVVQCACCNSCRNEGRTEAVNQPLNLPMQPYYVLLPVRRPNRNCYYSQVNPQYTCEKQVQKNTNSLTTTCVTDSYYNTNRRLIIATAVTNGEKDNNASQNIEKIPESQKGEERGNDVKLLISVVQDGQENQTTQSVSTSISFRQEGKDVRDNLTQTDWCDVLLEARSHPNGYYSLHLPPLEKLQRYGI